MKIKCPVCDEYVENFDNLKKHLWSSKTIEGDYIILAENYIALIKKIHEILVKEEKRVPFAGSINHFERDAKVEVLKSLLEDNK